MAQKIISHLLRVSQTPALKMAYLYNAVLSEAIEGVLAYRTRERDYPSFSDEAIQQLTCCVLSLFDVPADLRGILQAKSCIIHIVTIFLSNVTKQNNLQEEISKILERLFYFLENSIPTARAKLIKRPFIKDSPILSFHLKAYEKSILADGSCPFYVAYSSKIHLAIRDFQAMYPDDKSGYEMVARAARYVYVYMPREIMELSDHPVDMPRFYMKKLKAVLMEKLDSNSRAELAESYEKIFEHLLKRTPKKRRGKTEDGSEKKQKRNPFEADISVYQFDDVTVESDDSDDDIEFAGSNGLVKVDPEKKVISKKPSLSREWFDAISCANFRFWWDIHCLQMDEISALYESCAENWERSGQFDAIIIYLLLLLNTGVDSNKLLALSLKGGKVPYIKKYNDRLYLVQDTPIKRKNHEPHENCLEVSESIYVPLPDRVAELIKLKIKNQENLFSYKNNAGKETILTLDHITKFLQKKVSGKLGIDITISRIQTSFHPLYTGRFGLDSILACYVSGEDSRLYKSQLHYIYVPAEKLGQNYAIAANTLDSRVVVKARNSESAQGLKKEKPGNYELFYGRRNFYVPEGSIVPGYGSPRVPVLEKMRETINKLKSSIRKISNVCDRHNLYICYMYLCLSFAGGLRPRNEPNQNILDLDTAHNTMVIRDKQSPMFAEERLILMPPTAKKILSKLAGQFPKLKLVLRSSVSTSFANEVQNELFFFLDKRGNKTSFTLQKFRETLKSTDIEFDYPDNAGRHYLKTYLFNNDISLDISDAWCGHAHAGKEALNLASSVLPAETFEKCKCRVDSMLRELEFEEINYLEGAV